MKSVISSAVLIVIVCDAALQRCIFSVTYCDQSLFITIATDRHDENTERGALRSRVVVAIGRVRICDEILNGHTS